MRPGALLPGGRGRGPAGGFGGLPAEDRPESGLTGRRLADQVAGDLKIPRRQVYQTYLALKEQGRVE